MKKKLFISTPIYYPSANMHIGNAYTTVMADILARFYKQRGAEVFFLTGTDEHGEKIQKKAQAANITPIEFVDKIVANTKTLWSNLKIEYSDFIRTTEKRHYQVVEKVFSQLLEQGDIYLGHYKGYYCTPCETFWTEIQLKNQKCPDCQREVYITEEEAYFFRISKYKDRLLEFYNSHPDFIEPESVKSEMMNNFIEKGLQDLCVSRTSFNWGISVQENKKHVVYVWLDALLNYITALGYASADEKLFQKFWHNDGDNYILHLVGKEIARFHTIYWPIFLMSLSLPLPNKIFAHGWIISKDGKVSKSKGGLVDPNILINRYGVDSVRYFLARDASLRSDNLYSHELFLNRINVDLVNDLGNLLRRSLTMVNKYYEGVIPSLLDQPSDYRKALLLHREKMINEFNSLMENLYIDKALMSLFDYLRECNKLIEESKPWEMAKNADPNLAEVIYILADALKVSAILSAPILVDLSKEIIKQLGLDEKILLNLESLSFSGLANTKIIIGEVLFKRIDIVAEIKALEDENQ